MNRPTTLEHFPAREMIILAGMLLILGSLDEQGETSELALPEFPLYKAEQEIGEVLSTCS